MFDVGFQEIALIGVIALMVIGPERLPSVARSVGLWVGKVQRFVAGVKTDIRNELQNDELRGLLSSQEDQIRELKESLTETRNEFARSASIASSSLTDGMSSAVEQVRGAAEAVKDNATEAATNEAVDVTKSSEPAGVPSVPSDASKTAVKPTTVVDSSGESDAGADSGKSA